MATITHSGDIATPSKGFNLKVDVSYEQDITSNKTTITAVKGYVKRNDSSYYPYNTTSDAKFIVKGINADNSQTQLYTVTKHPSYNLGSNGYKEVLNIAPNLVISHLDNGKKSIIISFSFDGKLSSYYPNGSISKTIELPTISRKSSVTCADGNIGSATTINISRTNSNFTHTLTYDFQGLTGTITTKTSETSIGWEIPTSFYDKIPDTKWGIGTITCDTYLEDTLIGSSNCNFKAFVVNSEPEIGAIIEDINTSSIQATGDKNKLIKYVSNAQVTVNAEAKNSATIKSIKVVNGSQTKTTATSIINEVDSGQFDVSCVDSRGFSASASFEKTIIEYIKPVIVEAKLSRPNTTSNIINATIFGLCFNGSFGAKNNTLELKYRYKKSIDTTWTDYTTIVVNVNENNFIFSGELGTNFNHAEAYNFEFVLSDLFMSNTYSTTITRGIPIIDIGENDVNVNGSIYENNKRVVTIEDGLKSIGYKELYNNESGTSGTITLSEAVSNFKFLAIFYHGDGDTYSCEIIDSPEGKRISLDLSYVGETDHWIQAVNKRIIGTSITTLTSSEVKISNTSVSRDDFIKITKVLGWN